MGCFVEERDITISEGDAPEGWRGTPPYIDNLVPSQPREDCASFYTVGIKGLGSAGGGTRKHNISISKSLVFITLKPCFKSFSTPLNNLLFMPVSARLSQKLAPD